jgi:hypothetical protein
MTDLVHLIGSDLVLVDLIFATDAVRMSDCADVSVGYFWY